MLRLTVDLYGCYTLWLSLHRAELVSGGNYHGPHAPSSGTSQGESRERSGHEVFLGSCTNLRASRVASGGRVTYRSVV